MEVLNLARDRLRSEVAEVILISPTDRDLALTSSIAVDGRTELMVPSPGTRCQPLRDLVRGRRSALALNRHEVPADLRLASWSEPIRDGLFVSLSSARREIGILVVANRTNPDDGFDRDDLRVFQSLADEAVEALDDDALDWRFEHVALHDGLTGLANRSLYISRVENAVATSDRPLYNPTLLLVDIDDLEAINDRLGHAAGDRVLAAVAERLRASLRIQDTAARLGGDEFAVLVEDCRSKKAAVSVAERLLAAFNVPFVISSHEVQIRASVGIVMSHRSEDQAELLLGSAEMAMHAAKSAGKARYAMFEPQMAESGIRRRLLRSDLHEARARAQISVVYQPWVDLETNRIVAAEALVRWRHPNHGEVRPGEFIPLSEEIGLIGPIGAQVLEDACTSTKRWQRIQKNRSVAVSVNVSMRQLEHPRFLDDVLQALNRTGLEPGRLILELSESTLTQDSGTMTVALHRVRELGIRLAVDDFGTGHLSLSRLEHLPVDILKIARPFMAGVIGNPDRVAFLGAIIRLGDSLGLKTVAQGIESRDQAAIVRELGCNLAQGYLFAHPMTESEISQLLASELLLPRTRS